jgi:hypothetical protein
MHASTPSRESSGVEIVVSAADIRIAPGFCEQTLPNHRRPALATVLTLPPSCRIRLPPGRRVAGGSGGLLLASSWRRYPLRRRSRAPPNSAKKRERSDNKRLVGNGEPTACPKWVSKCNTLS